jgi:hypothetical protein
MTMVIDGSSGVTFPNSTIQASAGQILQVVNATYNTSTAISSGTFVATGLTASITPKFSTSKILIIASGTIYNSATNQSDYTIYKNGTTNLCPTSGRGFAEAYSPAASGQGGQISALYLDSPATTSSTTYALYGLTNGSISYFAINGSTCSITLLEIAG